MKFGEWFHLRQTTDLLEVYSPPKSHIKHLITAEC